MTSVILIFLVHIIPTLANVLEDTMQFEFKESQLISDREMLLEIGTLAGDSFK